MFDYSSLETSLMIIIAILISDFFSIFIPYIKKIRFKALIIIISCLVIIIINQIISLIFIKTFMP